MPVLTISSTDDEQSVEEQKHSQAMAELGEQVIKQQQEAEDQRLQKALKAETEPDESEPVFAGKYRSAQELERAYLELQRKLGERAAGEDEDADSEPEGRSREVEADNGDTGEPEPEAEGDVSPVDKAITSAMEEFDENLSLKPETIEELAKLPAKELIEAWARSVQAQRQQVEAQSLNQQAVDQILGTVGGEAKYKELVGWAADNLNPQEIASFDAVVASGNADAITWAVQGLKARYEAEYGLEGVTVTGGKPPANNDIFRSHDELFRAMGDPRYESDPAYRADVMEKLARSGDLI